MSYQFCVLLIKIFCFNEPQNCSVLMIQCSDSNQFLGKDLKAHWHTAAGIIGSTGWKFLWRGALFNFAVPQAHYLHLINTQRVQLINPTAERAHTEPRDLKIMMVLQQQWQECRTLKETCKLCLETQQTAAYMITDTFPVN